MGVSSHLHIDLNEYDARIRTFVPDYERMLDAAARALRALKVSAPEVVELGIGSGALAARCLEASARMRLTGIDADPGMLAQAARRLAPFATRVTLVAGDFSRGALPACDAFVASLALHHLHTPASKLRVYRQAARALRGGGLLVSADAALPDDPALSTLARDAWSHHLRQSYTGSQTKAYFRAWSTEDTYFTLSQEFAMLRRAGLTPEVIWREGGFAVIAARKPIMSHARPAGAAGSRGAVGT